MAPGGHLRRAAARHRAPGPALEPLPRAEERAPRRGTVPAPDDGCRWPRKEPRPRRGAEAPVGRSLLCWHMLTVSASVAPLLIHPACVASQGTGKPPPSTKRLG